MKYNDDTLFASTVPPTSRRKAREIALRALYSLELTEGSLRYVVQEHFGCYESETPALAFAKELVERTYNKREEYNEIISKYSANWEYGRIAILDKLILCLAICEMLEFFDIPPKVSIDEAIELSKRYSTEKSAGFINGVLDAVLLNLKKSNQIVKVGRGLKSNSSDSKVEPE